MGAPRTTLRAFLATARSALSAAKGPVSTSRPPTGPVVPVTLVVGNESADLDSLCSALLLAYFRSHQRPSSMSSPGQVHIPLCNIPRADLTLRPEFLAVLRDVDLRPEDVLTLSDIFQHQKQEGEEEGGDEGGYLAPESTHWLLVDHNALTGPLAERYSDRVVGCIDHHDDEGKIPPVDDGDKDAVRIIEKSGSCSSLVVEHCRDTWDALSSSSSSSSSPPSFPTSQTIPSEEADDQLSRLVLAPLLVDTTDLTDPHKTTTHDTDMAAYVEGRKVLDSYWTGGKYDRKAYFDRLSRLKSDIADMTIRDVLRKDYKEWAEEGDGGGGGGSSAKRLKLGTSSCPRSFGYLVDGKCGGDPRSFSSELRAWADERNLDIAAVLTSFNNNDDDDDEEEGEGSGEFRRELLVWTRGGNDGRLATDVAIRFADTCGETLGLEVWADGRLDSDNGSMYERCWSQTNVANSRKQVAPMLRDAMRKRLSSSS